MRSVDPRLRLASAVLCLSCAWSVLAQDASPGATPAGAAKPDAANPRQSGTPGQTEVAASYSREWLKYNPDDWIDTRVEALHKFADRALITGAATESQRYGLRDTTASLGGYYPLAARTTVYAEVAASGTHRVLPKDSEYLQLTQSFGTGWGVLAGYKHVDYNSTKVEIGDLTLEKYFSSYRAAFTAFPSHSSTAGNAASYRLQLSAYYGENEQSNVQVVLVKGTEVDKPTGIDQVVATSVKSGALFGRHWLHRSWSLTWSVGRTLQETATRNSASVGLRYRF
ncbi:MAG TPA: YaiO family outer membrane beta-barrel protein [Burkholderiales bacterium]|nr:YaiO family outer membrane beta-barrel protein [Burkholderiales bacterium]